MCEIKNVCEHCAKSIDNEHVCLRADVSRERTRKAQKAKFDELMKMIYAKIDKASDNGAKHLSINLEESLNQVIEILKKDGYTVYGRTDYIIEVEWLE